MAGHEVHCSHVIDAPPDAVWGVLREFCAPWHPLIEWIKAEQGGAERVFEAKGEGTIYRERMTYRSDSDRVLRYEHVEGIRGAASYRAECRVDAQSGGSVVQWSAKLAAPGLRGIEIAAGTKFIFDAGLQALAEIFALSEVRIAGAPGLAVTHTRMSDGPLLILLHGIGGNRSNWRNQLFSIGPHMQAASLDMRGYGESGPGPTQSRVDDYCNDILRVMTRFGKDRAVICGLSYGSWIATSFAMRHPKKLAGLVLCGGCTGMSEAPEAEREAFLAARQKPLDEGKSPKDFAPAVVEILAGPKASETVRQELLASIAAIPAATYRDAVRCFTRPEEKFDFGKIICPVLMMTGEHDRLAPPSEIRAVAGRIHAAGQAQQVSFEVISGAGHVCNLENPFQFNHHLTRFIKGLNQP